VHFTQIISADRNLDPGEEVEFSVVQRQKGPAARDVIRL
jgi:cold shock CspA family protein